jgi:hypothetical protein
MERTEISRTGISRTEISRARFLAGAGAAVVAGVMAPMVGGSPAQASGALRRLAHGGVLRRRGRRDRHHRLARS